MRRIAAVLVALTLALSGLLAFRLHAQEAQQRGPSGGSAEIEGTEIAVAARLPARVVSVAAKKGEQVRAGDTLVTLDCAEPEAALAEAEARLAAARAQAEAAVAAGEAAEGASRAAAASVHAATAQADALQSQRDVATRQAARLDALGADVAESDRDQVRSSAAGLDHQLKAAAASRSASGEQARAATRQARAARSQAEASQAGVKAAEAAVSRARLLVAECEVRAPRDGWVEEVAFEPGELVGPGTVLVRLIDLAEVKATFYLPNAELAAAKAGAAALVIADAFPGESFRGTVRTVALKAEFTPRNIQTRSDRDRLVYPVEITLANPELKLRAGMPVQVTLPGTER